MEGQFPHHSYMCIPQTHHFYSSGQKCAQQQWTTSHRYSAHPKVMSQCSRQNFRPLPQLSSREIFSPPAITFQKNQSSTAFNQHSSQFATRVPSSFDFFNQMPTNPMFNQLHQILAEECQNFNMPSTLIQTVTQDYSGYSVSCQQSLQIHRMQPTTDIRYCSNRLQDSIPPSNTFHNTSAVQQISNSVSSGSCDEHLPGKNRESTSPSSKSSSSRSSSSSLP